MKTIEVDDDVFTGLEHLVRGFNDTPNSVIRRLLQAAKAPAKAVEERAISTRPEAGDNHPFHALITSSSYLVANAGGRYFQILSFLHQQHGREQFERLTTHAFGGRVYFARDSKVIERSGNSTNPKLIPGTAFYALSTLSNAAKRNVLRQALTLFNYPPAIIAQVVATIPDSGITKPRHSQPTDYTTW